MNTQGQARRLVEKMLSLYPETRDSDYHLIIRLIKEQLDGDYDFIDVIHLMQRREIIGFETASRLRRKIQQERQELRGSNYQGRQKKSENYIEVNLL